MAIPALPADDSDGNDWTAAKVNAIYDHLQLHRDTRPIFKGYLWDGVVSPVNDIANVTSTTMGPGDSSAFVQLGGLPTNPTINAGGFTTATADADPESLVIPEAGVYWVHLACAWEANTTGLRLLILLVDGTADTTVATQDAADANGAVYQECSGLIDVAADAELDARIYQDSGGALGAVAWMSCIWMQST